MAKLLFVFILIFTSCKKEESPVQEKIAVKKTVNQSNLIKICEDSGQWPPYLFRNPKNEEEITGAAIELLKEALHLNQYSVQIELMPWKRCLKEFENNTYQIIPTASSNAERERDYIRMKEPLFTLDHAFYFSKKKYPNNPQIESVKDVDKFQVCGLRGFNFKIYGFDISKINEVTSPKQLIKMAQLERCDLLIGYREIWESLNSKGTIDLSGLGRISIPNTQPLEYYSWVNKVYPEAQKLIKILDENHQTLQNQGRKKEIFENFGVK